jgi:hypothetical protein
MSAIACLNSLVYRVGHENDSYVALEMQVECRMMLRHANSLNYRALHSYG